MDDPGLMRIILYLMRRLGFIELRVSLWLLADETKNDEIIIERDNLRDEVAIYTKTNEKK